MATVLVACSLAVAVDEASAVGDAEPNNHFTQAPGPVASGAKTAGSSATVALATPAAPAGGPRAEGPVPWTWLPHGTIDFASATEGWFCGYNPEAGCWTFFRTADGGSNWAQQRRVWDIHYSQYGPSQMQLAALSERCCFAYDDRRVLRTVDGGRHWQRMYTTANSSTQICRACFASPSVGFCSVSTMSRGYVKRTTNGGRTWVTIARGSASPFGALSFVDSRHGWVVKGVRVLRTVNGGRTWIRCGRTRSDYISALSFVTRSTGWIAGIWGVEKTIDGGRSWSVKLSSWWNGGCSLFAQSATAAWASGIGGERGMTCLPASDWPPSMFWPIGRTTDGGASWARISLAEAHYFEAVGDRCWALCRPENGDSYLMRSNDRGDTWTQL
jgi:photosystem II stability/assembly factor-like uncharacterized protein